MNLVESAIVRQLGMEIFHIIFVNRVKVFYCLVYCRSEAYESCHAHYLIIHLWQKKLYMHEKFKLFSNAVLPALAKIFL